MSSLNPSLGSSSTSSLDNERVSPNSNLVEDMSLSFKEDPIIMQFKKDLENSGPDTDIQSNNATRGSISSLELSVEDLNLTGMK